MSLPWAINLSSKTRSRKSHKLNSTIPPTFLASARSLKTPSALSSLILFKKVRVKPALYMIGLPSTTKPIRMDNLSRIPNLLKMLRKAMPKTTFSKLVTTRFPNAGILPSNRWAQDKSPMWAALHQLTSTWAITSRPLNTNSSLLAASKDSTDTMRLKLLIQQA